MRGCTQAACISIERQPIPGGPTRKEQGYLDECVEVGSISSRLLPLHTPQTVSLALSEGMRRVEALDLREDRTRNALISFCNSPILELCSSFDFANWLRSRSMV